jgi:hypothetical protein
MYHPFSIAETIKAAWNVIKKNYVSLIVFTIITFVCNAVIQSVNEFFVDDGVSVAAAIIRLVIMLFEAYITLTFYRLLLTLIDKQYYEFSFGDIWPTFRMAINAVAIGVIIIVVAGTVLFIENHLGLGKKTLLIVINAEEILVLYISIRLIFCLCFVVDDDSGPIESLRQSLRITRNNFFKLLALILIVFVFVAVLLLVINAFITLFVEQGSPVEDLIIKLSAIVWFAIAFPTTQVMIITTYRKLVYSTKDIDDDIAETD